MREQRADRGVDAIPACDAHERFGDRHGVDAAQRPSRGGVRGDEGIHHRARERVVVHHGVVGDVVVADRFAAGEWMVGGDGEDPLLA